MTFTIHIHGISVSRSPERLISVSRSPERLISVSRNPERLTLVFGLDE